MADLGRQYAALVAAYVFKNYSSRGIEVRREVDLGMSIIGKRRRVDILLIEPSSGSSFAMECKFQHSGGTTDEKIPYALRDIASMPIPGCIVYGGPGFSKGVIHLLQASEHAVYCVPDPESLAPLPPPKLLRTDQYATWELDHILAMTFGWWDLIGGQVQRDEEVVVDPAHWSDLAKLLAESITKPLKGPKKVGRASRAGGAGRSQSSA